jgi:hypothetical protein
MRSDIIAASPWNMSGIPSFRLNKTSVNDYPFFSSLTKASLLVSCIYQGNLGESRGRGRENPSGEVGDEENNDALVKAEYATAKNGALVKLEDGTAASLEANKAMCHNALFDILVSEKFALLCDLLAATFHVNKPDDVIGLQKIDAKMRNGDYAQNPAQLDHDIKQVPICLFHSFSSFISVLFPLIR